MFLNQFHALWDELKMTKDIDNNVIVLQRATTTNEILMVDGSLNSKTNTMPQLQEFPLLLRAAVLSHSS